MFLLEILTAPDDAVALRSLVGQDGDNAVTDRVGHVVRLQNECDRQFNDFELQEEVTNPTHLSCVYFEILFCSLKYHQSHSVYRVPPPLTQCLCQVGQLSTQTTVK